MTEKHVVLEKKVGCAAHLRNDEVDLESVRATTRERVVSATREKLVAEGYDAAADIEIVWECRAVVPAYRRPDWISHPYDELLWERAIREAHFSGHHKVVIERRVDES